MRSLLVLLCLISSFSRAQFTYVLEKETPVTGSSDGLKFPWAGGLNASEYNSIDLNNDENADLAIFDRMSNSITTFINDQNQYVHAPEYENYFPDEVNNWMLLRDFNCDGKPDIFTSHPLGIQVFRNVSENGILKWERFRFTSASGSKSDALLTKGFTTRVNLQLDFSDLPSIGDVDGDGDVDIFNMRFGSGETVEFHQNFSVERYGTCDSLEFERLTQNWGNFRECGCGSVALNNEPCDDGGGRVKHAGGKALLALDANGDSKMDLLFSEAECSTIYLLTNDGTSLNGNISSFHEYPDVTPIDFERFPAAFFEDVDFDGKRDLISSTNLFSKEDLNIDLRNSNWFYRNEGTNENPNFVFQQQNFLQDEMIDVGDNAVPAFSDFDGDGDYDMFVSNHSTPAGPSSIFLFENTGNVEVPAFTLADEDYLGFESRPYYNLKIHFADLDHNGTQDLIFSASDVNTSFTDLFFIANKSQSDHDFTGQSVTQVQFNLSSNENLTFADLNADGFVDIVAGRGNGNIEYWKNTASQSQIAFSIEDDNFASEINNGIVFNTSFAIDDLDGDSSPDYVAATGDGVLKLVGNFENDNVVMTDLVFNEVAGAYVSQNLGGQLWPVIVNLFNSTRPAIVVGTQGGGIRILKNDNGLSLPLKPSVNVYPNPLDRNQLVKITADRPMQMEIISSVGQILTEATAIPGNEVVTRSFGFLAPGVYVLKFSSGRRSVVKRIVIY